MTKAGRLRVNRSMDTTERREPVSDTASDWRIRFAAAIAVADEGNYREAANSLRALHQDDPDNLNVLRVLTRSTYRAGLFDEAAQLASKLFEAGRGREAEVILARIAFKTGDMLGAAERWRAIATDAPEHPEAAAQSAQAFFKLGRFADAVAVAKISTDLDNGNRSALRILIRSLSALGEWRDVELRVMELLSFSPEDAVRSIQEIMGNGQALSAARIVASDCDAIDRCAPELKGRLLVLLRALGRDDKAPLASLIEAARLNVLLDSDDLAALVKYGRLLLRVGHVIELDGVTKDISQRLHFEEKAKPLLRELRHAARDALERTDLIHAFQLISVAAHLDPMGESTGALAERERRIRAAKAFKAKNEKEARAAIAQLLIDYPGDPSVGSLQSTREADTGSTDADAVVPPGATADDYLDLARRHAAAHNVDGAIDACFRVLLLRNGDPAARSILQRLTAAW